MPPEPLSAHDQIIPVLERFKDELKADPDQSRKLVDWLMENVEEGQRETLFADLPGQTWEETPRPPPAPGPVEQMSAESIAFENPEDEPVPPLVDNAPPTAPPAAPEGEAADDFPEMPDFLRRKQELCDALLERQPWLRHDPERLEAEVLACCSADICASASKSSVSPLR